MLVSPKWQTMWMESQHCSKSIMNVPLPSQQTKKALDDLRTNCCSPNKAVQLEALKCWGMWINNQNPNDWKLNTVCFTAVRPLITKTLQPLNRDVDICKLKLSLMWALLVKAQNLMQLEGPQYILEVFLQSCLSWLTYCNGDNCENEITTLIFQFLLGILNKSESLTGCDRVMFPPLSTDIFHSKKVFHRLADKFLNIFIHWRKVPEKKVVLKSWKHFLEQCDQSCSHIPIPLWHKLFKFAGQICSEKSEPVKDRLAFLHSCATTLKSVLPSSKFIDFGNLMTTPCEVFLKKLVELCLVESEEVCDSEMFLHSKEICQVLSEMSVAIGGFDLCIGVLDVLEEFCLRDLFWGVWCGLVHCFKARLQVVDRKHYTKPQMKFYRKLRGVAINFELDKDVLHKDCVTEVEKHIAILSLNCFCSSRFQPKKTFRSETALGKIGPSGPSKELARVAPIRFNGTFAIPRKGEKTFQSSENLNFDLVKAILKYIGVTPTKPSFNYLFSFRFIKSVRHDNRVPVAIEFRKVEEDPVVSCLERKPSSPVPESTVVEKAVPVSYEKHQKMETDEEMICTPRTRSRRRAAEEEKKKQLESRNKKRRKSFEILVQEIVRKNKERKTEKNSRKKSPVVTRKSKKKLGKENRIVNDDRKLRKSKKEEIKVKKEMKLPLKSDGKLENYFKIITKKSGDEKKEEKKPKKVKREEKKVKVCCHREKKEGNSEIGWRQTSLKTMMNRKKQEKQKLDVRTRSRGTGVVEEKKKGRKVSGSPPPKVMRSPSSKAARSPLSKVTESPLPNVVGSPLSKMVRSPLSKVVGSPLSKLSPFKEVFHDHEYAKMELQELEMYERLLAKQEMNKKAGKLKNKHKITQPEEVATAKTERKVLKNCKVRKEREKTFEKHSEKQIIAVKKGQKAKKLKIKQKANQQEVKMTEVKVRETGEVIEEQQKTIERFKKEMDKEIENNENTIQPDVVISAGTEAEVSKTCEHAVNREGQKTIEKLLTKVEVDQAKNESRLTQLEVAINAASETEVFRSGKVNEKDQKPNFKRQIIKTPELKCKKQKEPEIPTPQEKPNTENAGAEPESESTLKDDWVKSVEDKTLEENPDRRGKKRVRMLDSLKPSKKLKLSEEEEEEEESQEEKLPVEITEKENLEDFQSKLVVSPSQKEKSMLKVEESPKGNRMISSRALRMIALVPESTKGGQMQREASTRVEVLKCKKAPNVDKNSRASKMLALLSENVTEVEEVEEEKLEETPRKLTTTPNMKTPVSSMKSPKSVKKRKSIGFDDAKNETVLYQTDTPPSQILEEKKKCRRIKPAAEC